MILTLLMAALPAGKTAARARKTSTAASAPRTVLLPSPGNPLVAIRLFFEVGGSDDPHGKEGLAALTAAMLGEGGTRERTSGLL